ncbi:hypothetical protein BY996DRAFT_4577431 [Phakopsora pachyrhizi]|nr:hypothetical protein BY996DRAFT_4577431 [Phakopsora pachyrhizi]
MYSSSKKDERSLLEGSLSFEKSDLVAKAVLDCYSSLPAHGKPIRRDDGRSEYTIIAGIVLYKDSLDQGPYNPNEAYKCISLGTGMRCLPREKMSPYGDQLNDSHAEILVRRGFRLWLYQEVRRKIHRGEVYESPWIENVADQKNYHKLRDSVQVYFYVSTLPCGDASMFLTDELCNLKLSGNSDDHQDCFSKNYLLSISLGLSTEGSVSRGRMGFSEPVGKLRTKPGRLDSPPTTSHSCSDKLALWNAVGIQGALLSAFYKPIYVSGYVFGNEGFGALDQDLIFHRLKDSLIGRTKDYMVGKDPLMGFTHIGFQYSFQTQLGKQLGEEHKNNNFEKKSHSYSNVVATVNCLSYIDELGTEIIDRYGIRLGGSTRRHPSGSPLSPKIRSRVSKLELYRRHNELCDAIGLSTLNQVPRYHSCKHPEFSSVDLNFSYLNSRILEFQAKKDKIKKTEGSPLRGWLVHGLEWEKFDVLGQIKAT